jgi:hypothetical protein
MNNIAALCYEVFTVDGWRDENRLTETGTVHSLSFAQSLHLRINDSGPVS